MSAQMISAIPLFLLQFCIINTCILAVFVHPNDALLFNRFCEHGVQ